MGDGLEVGLDEIVCVHLDGDVLVPGQRVVPNGNGTSRREPALTISGCGDGGAPQTVMAVCTAIPVHQGCSVRCWEGVDRLRRLHRREVGATANSGTD